ncbi:hypothetical protein JB92DRAFT_2833548 [Gautieria morchelliformis]|nr:hypothetical protein JB92DRAFT_2833548 [Gautieria morchelliformis]
MSLSSVCSPQVPVTWLVAAMPPPRSKRAPKMFDGDDDEISDFLTAYERCALDAQLPKTGWVKCLFRYLTPFQKLVFAAFKGHDDEDWDVFKASIKEAFGCKD